MIGKLRSLYSLKFIPFRPSLPGEALFVTPAVDTFVRRVETGLTDGGFSLVTGDPGTGKSIVMRLLSDRLRALPDVLVGTIEHPQSRTSDFYRELGELFGVSLSIHNRFGGFKALRTRWSEHITQTRTRPVLLLDEAQEIPSAVLNELCILASKDLDARQLLCVVFAGDSRLPERLRSPELLPIGSSIHRLTLDYACRDELLTVAADRELPRLDDKLYLDVFAPAQAQAGGQEAMKPLSPKELCAARELVELRLLTAATDALLTVLRFEHPTLEAPGAPTDPPTLRAARRRAIFLRRGPSRLVITLNRRDREWSGDRA